MNYKILGFIFFVLIAFNGYGQKKDKDKKEKAKDSIVTDLNTGSFIKSKRPYNPLAPSKAAFYSAIVPGLGQIYNHSYWKLPIIYGGMGAAGYFYVTNNKYYHNYRDAFKRRQAGYTDDPYYDLNGDGEGPDVTDSSLENGQDYYQSNRDLSLLIFIGIYALNIIDANVDAHLKQFNINKDLTLQPYLEETDFYSTPDMGVSLTFHF
ncbi:hypothetical protein NBRC110019_13570 [Neptunitalea chrysea]|uniref:DUF5683 domain-containing protein n=1 Tax=Neptunitalea chrysea TaxID=1647581 RepID=A0A9W6B7S7_9FLAO|nr:DUF5683 domain-containing protein [Neptunitalea chrysea]GLB52318.1 hypothetical protein NBRC110019_13570 [Neptunitalea chrysea]